MKDDTGTQSLLTQVCTRSLAIGKLDGVDGSRPFCSPDGTRRGARGLLVRTWLPGHHHPGRQHQPGPGATPFIATYQGVKVELAKFGEDYCTGQIVPIRGDAPATRPCPPTR